ncbi:MAG: site-specific integrase [Methyloprofundus sp.]|nr:site-specific integrase [Methyloprofundus sp.]
MARIEDKQIRTWIKSNIRFDAKSDSGGLYIRYRKTDKTPIWFFRYKIAKIEHRVIIGRYPDMTLAQARREASVQRVEVQKGNNPAITKKEIKHAAVAKAIAEKHAQTVTELVEEFLQRNVDGKLKSANARRLSLYKYLIPTIGTLRIEKVEPRHIADMLDNISQTAPTTANDILAWSKQIFNYAIKRQIIRSNPFAAFDASDAGGKEKSRDRYLSRAELVLLFQAMRDAEKFTRTHYLATKLLLLLGCRKGELLSSKRSDFDTNKAVWHMSPDNKTESPIDIPLSTTALKIINELMETSIDHSEFLFPTTGSKRSKSGHVDDGYLNKPIRRLVIPLMGDIENFTIHDLRATFKTHLCSKAIGVDRFVTERCLNHKIPGMEGVYDRGDYFEERKAALELWAAFLEGCENDSDWNVTPIRKTL